VRKADRVPLAPGGACGDSGLDQRDSLGLVTGQAREPQGAEGRIANPSRFRDHIGLGDEAGRRAEISTPDDGRGRGAQVDRQLVQRARVTGESSLPDSKSVPAILIPQHDGGRLGQPAPAQAVFRETVVARERASRLAQRRRRGSRAVGYQPRQPVEQLIAQPGRTGRRRQRQDGTGNLGQVTGASQVPGEHRRHPRAQVRLAGQVEAVRLKALGGLEQQRGSVAAQARGEGGLSLQQVRPGAGELVERSGLRDGQQIAGLAECPGLQARLGCRQRSLHAARRVHGQRDRPLKECGRRG